MEALFSQKLAFKCNKFRVIVALREKVYLERILNKIY